MVSDSPLVEVLDLTFRPIGAAEPTLTHINLVLHPGEIVLLAGATGSGKSTLLHCMAGIAPIHTGGTLTGTLCCQGQLMNEWSVRQRSQEICTLLQNVELQIFTDRVSEEVMFGLENWNLTAEQIPQRVDHALREFGLQDQRHWSIQQLSAGQKQRLVLGSLLAIGQPVLLLDEPLAYLDAQGVDLLLRLLRARADQGQAILLVEHRWDVVRAVCDRAYHLQAGHLIEGWPPLPTISSAAPIVERPTTEQAIVLRSHNLSWGGYPAFPDLTVTAGAALFLSGGNGCGKTTLLKLLSGLLKPTTGSIECFGHDITHWKVTQIARQIGFVLQNPHHQLFGETVRAEVLQPGVQPDVAERLLEQLNLRDRAEQHPQALSQGQKRRLALGAVLARQPQICLLDEITVGQDPNSLDLMVQVLQDFLHHGGALILTSHDPLAAAALNAHPIELTAHDVAPENT